MQKLLDWCSIYLHLLKELSQYSSLRNLAGAPTVTACDIPWRNSDDGITADCQGRWQITALGICSTSTDEQASHTLWRMKYLLCPPHQSSQPASLESQSAWVVAWTSFFRIYVSPLVKLGVEPSSTCDKPGTHVTS